MTTRITLWRKTSVASGLIRPDTVKERLNRLLEISLIAPSSLRPIERDTHQPPTRPSARDRRVFPISAEGSAPGASFRPPLAPRRATFFRPPTRGVAGLPHPCLVGIALVAAAITFVLGLAQPLSPTIIDGTAQLRSLAVAGDGSAARPYVIEGLNINAHGDPFCLIIRNVSSHFIVRNCRFEGASESAILLQNARNGWFIDNVFSSNACAVSCSTHTANIIFAGNSFISNLWDATLDDSSTADWSDGVMGNYWDRARGPDENGDRILDSPYVLQLSRKDRPLPSDPHPLAEPIVGRECAPGHYLLHTDYSAGDIIEVDVSFRAEMSSLLLFVPTVMTVSATQVLQQRVLAAPGTGFFTVQETIVEDIGESTVNGRRETYESAKGRSTVRKVHRLGVMSSPGYGLPDIELATVEPWPDFPAGPVSVGHVWGSTRALDAAALGMERGQQVITTSFVLRGIELLDGDLCAVIHGELRSTTQGTTITPIFGELQYVADLSIQATVFFSLSRHRFVQQRLDARFEASLTAQGTLVQRQQGRVVTSARERPSSDETRVGDWTTPTQLKELAQLLARGEYATVAAVGRQLAAFFETAGQIEWQATALWMAATALGALERYREAIEIWEQALPLYSTLQNPQDEAAVFNSLAICYRSIGDYQRALSCYSRAFDLAGPEPDLRSTVLVNMAICLIAMGRYTQALKHLHEALDLRRGRDIPGQINVLNSLGICQRKLGQYDTAVHLYDEALELCGPEIPPELRLRVMLNKGAALLEGGQSENALRSSSWSGINGRRFGTRMERQPRG